MPAVIVLFRNDLRLRDHAAFLAAVETGLPIIPLFVLDGGTSGASSATPAAPGLGGAAKWWLHHSLLSLDKSLQELGGKLLLRRTDSQKPRRSVEGVLQEVVQESRASAVFAMKRYDAVSIGEDAQLMRHLHQTCNVPLHLHSGLLLAEPGSVLNAQGSMIKVFSAFKRALWKDLAVSAPAPVPAAQNICFQTEFCRRVSEDIVSWDLLPPTRIQNWAAHFPEYWTPGETGAQKLLEVFLREKVRGYKQNRDRLDMDATSRLSPHLHWGEISIRHVFSAVQEHGRAHKDAAEGAEMFLSELTWREFSHHLLFFHPQLPVKNLRPEFDGFPWTAPPAAVKAWQRGRTGFPVVDAGMRQLWKIGWMHNRARMIVGSFLVKDLLGSWMAGAEWFWDTLVDANLANNVCSWQWVAGSGADAAPYFRIFNPVLQSQKFDPSGAYIKKWVPELAKVPAEFIHEPWLAPSSLLKEAGVVLGKTYPLPMVDHKDARTVALAAFQSIKKRPSEMEDAVEDGQQQQQRRGTSAGRSQQRRSSKTHQS